MVGFRDLANVSDFETLYNMYNRDNVTTPVTIYCYTSDPTSYTLNFQPRSSGTYDPESIKNIELVRVDNRID